MVNTNYRRPLKIKLIGILDLDLSKRGIKSGEEFKIVSFTEKSGKCYIFDERIDSKYSFSVFPENYKVLEYDKTYVSTQEQLLNEELKIYQKNLNDIQNKIERTCVNCDTETYYKLMGDRTQKRKDITFVLNELKLLKKK